MILHDNKNKIKCIISFLIIVILLNINLLKGQVIKPAKGYTPQIGILVSMLEDLRKRVKNSVRSLNIEETDFLLDEDANRIGAIILHLAAVEKYYQVYTFENRTFNKEEEEKWGPALTLGESARETIIEKPISYYLKIWNDVRTETLRLLKTKDDIWLSSKVEKSKMNNHWAWFHVMEHQANHMGQIRLIINRIEKK